ncbi:hypothetical protein MNBD_GAMMA01-1889 [hydrothermal vent metagenome]|uniref:Integral membrane protein n=1 Tax=hydrothermal vent metagenome TaxID=652676 RepID=A0A3B0UQR1_9ZZZZ
MIYLTLKYLHILSAIFLFGTGLGSAFYKWRADASGNINHIALTNKNVVIADWLFTTPTVIFQPISGIWMAYIIGLPLATPWIMYSLLLYTVAGLCWLPVVYLQIKMQKIAEISVTTQTALPKIYWRYTKIWFALGVPAFVAMVLVVLLMTFKTLIF